MIEIKAKVEWSHIRESTTPCGLFAWHFEMWLNLNTFRKWDFKLNPISFDEAIALIRAQVYINETRLGLLTKGEIECVFSYLEGHFSEKEDCYFVDLHYRLNNMIDPFEPAW